MACNTNELLKYGINFMITVFPRIIAGGNSGFFFRTKRGRLFQGCTAPEMIPNSGLAIISGAVKGGDYFKHCSLEVVP